MYWLARTDVWHVRAFTQANGLAWNRAPTIKLLVCERTTELFFLSCEIAVGISPPAGGAAFIPRAEAQGLTPRFGKRLFFMFQA